MDDFHNPRMNGVSTVARLLEIVPSGRQMSDRAVCRNHRLSRHGALLLGDEQVLIQAGIGDEPSVARNPGALRNRLRRGSGR